MRALLIFPRYADALWTYKESREFLGKKASSPPLGLLIVAALLPKEWPKRFVDLNVQPMRDQDVEWAEIVLLGGMLAQQASALEVIDRCRQKGKRIIAGGPLFCQELIDQGLFHGVDHIVVGEAEGVFPRLLEDLRNGCAQSIYTCEAFPAMEQIPLPLWSLVDLRDYAVVNLQFVRGCPFQCEFCCVNLLNGRKPRPKSCAQIEAELEVLYQAGWRGSVFVCDDNLVGNKAMARDRLLPTIINWMKRRDHPFRFMGAACVDLANEPDLMDMLVEAGFESVTLGIESPHLPSLREVRKFQNTHADLLRAVHTIQQHGIEVIAGMILGFDNDPESIFDEQINFLQQAGIANALVSLLFAFPNTALHDRLKKEQRLLNFRPEEQVYAAINFIPAMPKTTLLKGYLRVLEILYSPQGYYDRLEMFIQSYAPASRNIHVQANEMWSAIRALYHLGIRDSWRNRFWQLLRLSRKKGTDSLVAFIRLAIQGYFMRPEVEQVRRVVFCQIT